MPYVSRLINEDFNKKGRIPTKTYSESVELRARTDLSVALRIHSSKYPPSQAYQKHPQQQNFIDYKQLLIPHYFLMETYTKSPHILELPEFFDNFKHNQTPPDYLISAILASSALSSPHKELHLKNFVFYEYNYKLSLIQMSSHSSKPSLPLIQALLILWDSDQLTGKYFRACARLTSALKLCQALNFNEITDKSSPIYRKYSEVQLNSIRRIWSLIGFQDKKNSNLINLPQLIHHQPDEEEMKVRNKNYFDQPIILQSLEKLPQKLVQPIDDWYTKLPPNIKYDTTCLLVRNRQNDPINNMRIIAYLRVLKGKLVILRHFLLKLPLNAENLTLKFKIIEIMMKVCNEQLKLLQDWFKLTADELDLQNEKLLNLTDSEYEDEDDYSDYNQFPKKPSNKKAIYNPSLIPPFPIEYFSELGLSYLQMLITLQKIQKSGLSARKRKWKWKSIDLEYNNLFELMQQFANNWQGSQLVLENFENCYRQLDADGSEMDDVVVELPEPVLELEVELISDNPSGINSTQTAINK
ncbi:hypothetical protein CONCODRAFT_78962 [Conidiobolus coronatus NRRL 28638]|uniref:Xylanolytic transcriptional activator regulatory domain-containing protein n=1 Tax=Conidiobolus coronatus (strain ATCC 28846 / CBS 209.66 / NRRL 28638) TaxID=796925 RepID=A0A137P5J8_CONC2|nr:hypothetical protein CONCODRAFT_78962 [Conidiobolus coronatus NRRL 28638]|eukprot:KXN70204.1 hypothetical protein CONCODRAFT_78962 [Conidiobolus coronatus NRRL 28638]